MTGEDPLNESSSLSKGDIVWVLTGQHHEEPGTVLETDCLWSQVGNSADSFSDDESSEKKTQAETSRTDGIMVQFNVSRIRGVYPPEKVRPMIMEKDGPKETKQAAFHSRRKRRSPRIALERSEQQPGYDESHAGLKALSVVKTWETDENEVATDKNPGTPRTSRSPKKECVDTAQSLSKGGRSVVTPSPEMIFCVNVSSDEQKSKSKPPRASLKRSSKDVSATGNKRIKASPSEDYLMREHGGDDDAQSSQVIASPTFNAIKKEKEPKKQAGKKNLHLLALSSKEQVHNDTEHDSPSEEIDNRDPVVASDDEDRPYSVGYAPTGRATCRRCDELINKSEVRVSHRPLFRGQRGFTVYRHLRCATFENVVKRARDVNGWGRLKQKDLRALEERILISAKEMEEEAKEVQPDELVQTAFCGEIRSAPPCLTASLLPFQVEGFSWMRHQEVNDEAAATGACRGGILADEMGMGKTLQTITTICDNRPILQRCSPQAKHPPDASDLEARKREQKLWEQALIEWNHEVKMNEIPKKMLSRKRIIAGARAGTLVVCPVIALLQWKSEVAKFTEQGNLTVGIYHGPNRASETTPEMLSKYDVVLTTYQCLEQDFRKMVSPNKVTCPNCGGKYKIDKLRVHLKYFCGEGAQRTEAQSRQRRSRPSGNRGRPDGRGRNIGKGESKKAPATAPMTKIKKKMFRLETKKEEGADTDLSIDGKIEHTTHRPARAAAKKASTTVASSVKEWGTNDGRGRSDLDDDDSSFGNDVEEESSVQESLSDSDDDDDDIPIATLARKQVQGTKKKQRVSKITQQNSQDSEEDDPVASAKEKQKKALEKAKEGKASKEKKESGKAKKGKAKGEEKKKFDSSDDSDSGEEDDPLAGIDMDELAEEAMSGAQFSVLHSFCWWRIVLDEAHCIKSRSSQTAAAAFSLTGIHRWCCSGTPLQNRVGELYSLIRFLRIDPMAHYFCRTKGCGCKSVHYRMKDGVCKDCGHRAFTHYSHFNKHILNVIQREGYSGDGRRAMFKLKNEVLDKCLLRRTKETRAEDLNLPPRIVSIRTLRLHPIEEDFYKSLYTQTRASFDDYVAEGTLLNNYAHIFDLLTKMRQAVDHPYLIVYSKNNRIKGLAPPGPLVANGSVECVLCHEPPVDRILSSCCQSGYCRRCVEEYIGAAGGESTPCPSCGSPFSINLHQKSSGDVPVDDGTLAMSIDSSTVPTLKALPHVQSGSILRRINLADFATSSKIEVLVQDLIEMRQQRPGSKALVFSQFVNMLDLIRWRLHSDPCLSHMGLGVRILHGGMDVKSRDEAIREFREDGNVRVLLMSLKAGGVALNLTVASEVFLVDAWWNPAAEYQAVDRTHRLGQYRPIRATRYICEGTVEERVLQLQEKKRLVFDGTIGRDAGSLTSLSVDDMKALFT